MVSRMSNGEKTHENVKEEENMVNEIVTKPVDDIFITNCKTEKSEDDKDTSSKNVMDFIKMVDNKIGELKENPSPHNNNNKELSQV